MWTVNGILRNWRFAQQHQDLTQGCGNFLHFKGFLSKRARQDQRLWRALSGRDEPKVKRGIVEQCCHKPCSIYHLEGYCDWLATSGAPLIACKKVPKSISGLILAGYVLSTEGNKASWPITQGSSLQRCEFVFFLSLIYSAAVVAFCCTPTCGCSPRVLSSGWG